MIHETTNIFQSFESGVQSYARSFPRVFDRAEGAEVWDADGNRYLDFLSGCGSLNYGHNNPVMKSALLDYISRDSITHSLDMHSVAKGDFLEALSELILMPRGLDYVAQFPGPTGTNAGEAALKLARKITSRTNVICFTNGFHGVSGGALATTGSRYHRDGAGTSLSGATAMPFDGYCGPEFNTLDFFERLLNDPSSGLDIPAAVIVETVQGEGGLSAARNEWLQSLQSICRSHEIVFIVDDIQAGCGRTGTFFSFEDAGLNPDIVTLAKSISGYGLPMSLVLIRRSMDIWKPGEHNGTFRGNNHAFVTAAAAIRRYWCDDTFSVEVRQKSQILESRLHQLATMFSSHVSEVRGRGFMRGLCFVDPSRAAQVSAAAFRFGLISERSGPHDEVVKCLAPLTIEQDQLTEGLEILARAMHEVLTPKTAPQPLSKAGIAD